MSGRRMAGKVPAGPSRRTLLGGAAGIGSLGLLSACGRAAAPEVDVDGEPRRGGTLRVGLVGGSSADSVDAHTPVNSGDSARVINLYDPLLLRGDDYQLEHRLAESFEPNAEATIWTAKLRRHVTFHDGSPLTADDVVFTFERIIDPDDPKSGAAGLAALDKIVAVDDHTVEFHLHEPDSALDDIIGQYSQGIVPRGYDPEAPIGTGPFSLASFDPGQSTVLKANTEYWDGAPYLDQVQLLNFNDTDAMVNALLSSQVDCIGQIPLALVDVLGSDERMKILNSETGMWLPFTMRVDVKPFDDVRVRQAMRLAVDRPQMIEQVFSGYGRAGNDMFAPLDPDYPKDFPQREQDVAEAKRLLAEAGHPDGIDVELVTAPIQSGAVEAAQVFAEQAKDAGIRISIRRVDTTTFFGEDYLQWDFAQSFWYTRNFTSQAVSCVLEGSPFNETHFIDEEFAKRIDAIRAELDEKTRGSLIREAQRQLFEEGGYIIWGFGNQVDAYQGYVVGLVENATGLPLSGYTFRRVWLGEVS
ncbi:ABC transporter substrate-binding protein [Brachybacterium subflavum]|uniref:ABC transporter substrate-binding protein n=1 Tax=Brachybacterium subflavum TaxID=2585206 RepID=UPI0012662ECE|nr:ABC transporter substrate-binding protein [Brachybacterium subflavum]